MINREACSLRSSGAKISEMIGALKALDHNVDGWSVPVLFMLSRKLHPSLRESWEKFVISNPLPTIKQFVEFLNEEVRVVEAAKPSVSGLNYSVKKPYLTSSVSKPKSVRGATTMFVNEKSTKKGNCDCCGGPHLLAWCGEFQRRAVADRIQLVRNKKLCWICFSSNHFAQNCSKKSNCKHCGLQHHSLLHAARKVENITKPVEVNAIQSGCTDTPKLYPTLPSEECNISAVDTHHMNANNVNSVVLLATAQAVVLDSLGKPHRVRILIDSASQGSFITADCAKRLGLAMFDTNVPIFGLARTTLGVANKKVCCIFQPVDSVRLKVEALIVDEITRSPSMKFNMGSWDHLHGIKLADPEYSAARSVDILLGAEWFPYVIKGNPIIGPPGTPSAIESIWGYCLVGRVGHTTAAIQSFCAITEPGLDKILRRFWEVEEPPSTPLVSEEDAKCESLYKSTVARSATGRYIVSLPFNSSPSELGDSRTPAFRRFQMIERRLENNPILRTHYNEFMKDYLDQNHMILASSMSAVQPSYFIPHHCIFRKTEEGVSKFRVVFDASMPGVGGKSLNQILYKGPKLQAHISDLLILFRAYPICVVCDIRQMYRNIAICDRSQLFQKIFWRFNQTDPIMEYNLTTVTYGVSVSPFLAIRTLRQLVLDEGEAFPVASEAIVNSTYMDDIICSCPTLDDALNLQKELIELMSRGKLELRKWMSNRKEILNRLPKTHCAIESESLSFENDSEPSAKILGLVWKPGTDVFSYKVDSGHVKISKRGILSELGKIYDPVGLISLVIFLGKCLLRQLWQLGVSWDDTLPAEVCDRWRRFRQELSALSQIAIPRCIYGEGVVNTELHGFADSSMSGFAAVVYLRQKTFQGTQLSLIMSKSRVAPVQVVSLPRLELCALDLLSRLLKYVKNLLESKWPIHSVMAWSDSVVALQWVRCSPTRWKTYVANRVSLIQQRISPDCCRHVPSTMNPADCASRGLFPAQLLEHPLWLSGPAWLRDPPEIWPIQPKVLGESVHLVEEELKRDGFQTYLTSGQEEVGPIEALINRCSTLSHLKRVMAWLNRFIFNMRNPQQRRLGLLTAVELGAALKSCLWRVQENEFTVVIKDLEVGRIVPSQLRNLCPFLDSHRLLRVGGRLRKAELPFDKRHPILLPKSHHFTNLVIDYFHKLYLHPGPLNLHAIILNQFWIISGRDVIRRRVLKCIQCFRTRPLPVQPQMADLPSFRLLQLKAFTICGVDYGGPYHIKLGKLRKARVYKGYICLFICLSTKAVHLELVSDLSTDAFIAALKRFIAGRGGVKEIYSDCGTNFIGARRKLEEWKQLISSNIHNQIIHNQLADQGIHWHFNPPASPHFGGIWEANIKAVKRLLCKVVGQQVLTYEEFYTLLVQVESTLNSRPLSPLSSDPNDMQALTPGHFLLMEPSRVLPEPDIPSTIASIRDRWTLLSKLYQSFWTRWSRDYLSTLQQRGRWLLSKGKLLEGMLVLIKDDNLPPLQWRLGRIKRLFTGADNIPRVAEVQTVSGILTRPAIKLCPLPLDNPM